VLPPVPLLAQYNREGDPTFRTVHGDLASLCPDDALELDRISLGALADSMR